MWYAVGTPIANDAPMKPLNMKLKLKNKDYKNVNNANRLKGHSLYPSDVYAPSTNDKIYIPIDDYTKKDPPPYLFIILDDMGYLYAESVNTINELDMLVSNGEGVSNTGDSDTYNWHFGFKVNPETYECENPEDDMWFVDPWLNGYEYDEEETVILEVQPDERIEILKDPNTMCIGLKDKKAVFKVSGNRSENIEFVTGNIEPPLNYREKWTQLVNYGYDRLNNSRLKNSFDYYIHYTHGLFLQFIRKNQK